MIYALPSRQCSTEEPAPYETPLQSLVPGSAPSPNGITSFGVRPALYEEPNIGAASLAPRDYEVVVNLGANQSSVDTYSSVENGFREAHNYMSPNEYTSLHPLNLDREQHIYTHPLQQSSSQRNDSQPDTHPQVVTSVTVEDTQDGSTTAFPPNEQAHNYASNHEYTSLHPPNLDREQHIYTPPLQRSSSSQQQEHTYFILNKRREGDIADHQPPNQDVREEGGGGQEGGGGGGGGGGEDVIFSESVDHMPKSQEHTYFSLEQVGEQSTLPMK